MKVIIEPTPSEYFCSLRNGIMIGPGEILKELYKSMVGGTMLGLFVKSDAKPSFIITRIKKISDDPQDPDNKLVSLPERDIHGNLIEINPIMSKNIIDIRDFNRLRGIESVVK